MLLVISEPILVSLLHIVWRMLIQKPHRAFLHSDRFAAASDSSQNCRIGFQISSAPRRESNGSGCRFEAPLGCAVRRVVCGELTQHPMILRRDTGASREQLLEVWKGFVLAVKRSGNERPGSRLLGLRARHLIRDRKGIGPTGCELSLQDSGTGALRIMP